MLPQSKSPSLRIRPTRTWYLPSILTTEIVRRMDLLLAAAAALAALPIWTNLTFRQKIGTFSA